MIDMYWSILVILCLSIKFTPTNAQKIIRLTKAKKNQEKSYYYIFPGENVKCKFVGGSKVIGMIANVSENTFEIDEHTFSRDSLKRIGKYRSAAPIILITCLTGGVALIATGNAHKLGSAALIGFSELILFSQLSPYSGTIDLERCNCNLDIINFEDLPKDKGRKRKKSTQ